MRIEVQFGRNGVLLKEKHPAEGKNSGFEQIFVFNDLFAFIEHFSRLWDENTGEKGLTEPE